MIVDEGTHNMVRVIEKMEIQTTIKLKFNKIGDIVRVEEEKMYTP